MGWSDRIATWLLRSALREAGGSVQAATERELRAEDARLAARIAELEQRLAARPQKEKLEYCGIMWGFQNSPELDGPGRTPYCLLCHQDGRDTPLEVDHRLDEQFEEDCHVLLTCPRHRDLPLSRRYEEYEHGRSRIAVPF